MKKSLLLNVLLLALFAVSCSKEQNLGDSVWTCEYPIQTQNGTTKELEDHTATMSIAFSSDITTAQLMTSIAGMYAANMRICDVEWRNKNKTSFYLTVLTDSSNGYNYSGSISGKTMHLKDLKADIERKLTRQN